MIAYVAKDLGSGACLGAHEDVQLPAYSTIKVLLAAAFWRTVERGELREAEPYIFQPGCSVGGGGVLRGFCHAAQLALADYAHLMLAVSDNDATNIVAGVVGFDRVNDLAAELGLRQTAMRRLMMDSEAVAAGRENHTSAADLATLLEELAKGEHPGAGRGRSCLEHPSACRSTSTASPATCRRPRATRASAATTRRSAATRTTARSSVMASDEMVMAIMTDGAGGFEAVSRTGAALYEVLAQG